MFPFALLYKGITNLRNWLYDNGHYHIYLSKTPTIIIGNLNVGGTGKTPHTAWLIEQLRHQYPITVLSRGYKRKTSGFIIADDKSTALTIGDEPMEYVQRFDNVNITVGEKRVDAAKQIAYLLPNTALIVLDDAFQHRAIKGHIQILLSTYEQPFFKDKVLPQGTLRESKNGYKRADYIIITKCPQALSLAEKQSYIQAIQPLAHQSVYFTQFTYAPVKDAKSQEVIVNNKKWVLITGIANNKPILDHFKQINKEIIPVAFKDHADFDAATIQQLLQKYPDDEYQIIVTQKDAVKWQIHESLWQDRQLGIVAVTVTFLEPPTKLLQDITYLIQQNDRSKA